MNFDLKEFADIIRRANDQNHFETDNAAWQVDAKQYIKEYLQKNINDKKVTVLA